MHPHDMISPGNRPPTLCMEVWLVWLNKKESGDICKTRHYQERLSQFPICNCVYLLLFISLEFLLWMLQKSTSAGLCKTRTRMCQQLTCIFHWITVILSHFIYCSPLLSRQDYGNGNGSMMWISWERGHKTQLYHSFCTSDRLHRHIRSSSSLFLFFDLFLHCLIFFSVSIGPYTTR